MIIIKSHEEIGLMQQAAVPTKEMLENLADIVKPGISTKDINDYVEEYIAKSGQKPAFKGYGGFPAAACVSVNEVIVHGIPSKDRILKDGDIVSVDLGTVYKGYYSDAARTYPVGNISDLHKKLIETCEASFFAGIAYARKGYRLGDISHAVQECVEGAGFSVIRDYGGHGLGRDLHEDPMILNYGKANHGPQLVPGMVLAIEPMIATGDYKCKVLSDGWTAVTKDGGYAAHYENTVVITDGDPMILTKK
ncbi:MAG: type I methionyl aminopeptidase [Firmicutes bacterium]|nr:type I methionyl aminopeptidase [Bacillota bacterium]